LKSEYPWVQKTFDFQSSTTGPCHFGRQKGVLLKATNKISHGIKIAAAARLDTGVFLNQRATLVRADFNCFDFCLAADLTLSGQSQGCKKLLETFICLKDA
jgi:hypothetical protein